MHRPLPPFLATVLLITACGTAPPPAVVEHAATHEVRDDLRRLYEAERVQGSLVVHDAGRDHWYYIDSAMAGHATLPASTWKIMGSLIGLESGVVRDADHVLPWDGVQRDRPELNRDLSLKEAYHVSAFWYHQRIVREIGPERFQRWLDTIPYGDRDTSGGFDQCWVRGGLEITPREQVVLLERLYRNELPFSQRTMDIVKGIMVQEETPEHIHRGKTGWADLDGRWIGWYVGWIEPRDGRGPFFFANRLIMEDTTSATFAAARKSIALRALDELGLVGAGK